MRDRFRLATLEKLRERAVEDALLELARRRRVLAEELEQLATLQRAIRDCVPAANLSGIWLQSWAMRRDQLRELADESRERIQQAEQQITDALADWQQARAQLRMVQALHERHDLECALEERRLEQKIADELAEQSVSRRIETTELDLPQGVA